MDFHSLNKGQSTCANAHKLIKKSKTKTKQTNNNNDNNNINNNNNKNRATS